MGLVLVLSSQIPRAKYQEPFLLSACFQRASNTPLFRPGANSQVYYFVRHFVKSKRLPAVKKLSIRGVEQTFRPAIKETLKLTLPRAARRVPLA
jgi:hypothetical protein